MNLILTGMRGVGKTTVGKKMAQRLKMNFVDLDEKIEQNYKQSIPEIVKQRGWKYFRKLEHQIWESVSSKQNTVIATGGGTLIFKKNQKLLNKNCKVILLVCPLATIKKRLKHKNNYPKLKHNSSSHITEIKKIWQERKNIYQNIAHLKIDTQKKSVKDIVREIEKNLMDKLPTYIIIGSGISGLNCALSAAETGQVLILTKKKTVDSSTNFAQGGIAAVLDQLDSFKQHITDTLEAGNHHNNRKTVELMIKESPKAIQKLIEIGVPFTRQEGKLLLTQEGGHSHRRIAFVGDYTGQAIEKALVKKIKQHPRITVLEHAFVVDLIIEKNRCEGVKVIYQNQIQSIKANYVILATGGIGQIYSHTSNPSISTGDGLAMGLRAGLEFADLEFIQFHPTVFFPQTGRPFLMSETLRGEGAVLLNNKGKRFMPKYHPKAELAPRDIVSRAIFAEEKKGQVYLKLKPQKKLNIKIRFPQIYQTLKKYGYDLTKDKIPVSCAAHYICGGIKVNLNGQTKTKNLFAFGEIAYTGVHGANRLASNSLLEALVFSNRILKHTARNFGKSKKITKARVKPTDILTSLEKKLLYQIRKKLHKIMWENVGIIRTMAGLKFAAKKLSEYQKQILSNISHKNSINYLETLNMLQTGTLITKSAQKRKKSLGCHYIK